MNFRFALVRTEENLFSERTIVVVDGAFFSFFTDFQKCVTCVTVLVFRHFFSHLVDIISYGSIIYRFSAFSVVFNRVKQRDKK